MEDVSILRFLLAFGVVLGLIALMAAGLRKWGGRLQAGRMGANARVRVVETCYLGPRHRLLLVRRDDAEHLLLLGPDTQTVVESGIQKGGV